MAHGLPDPFARHLAAAFDSLSEGILITGVPGLPSSDMPTRLGLNRPAPCIWMLLPCT